MCYTTDEYVKPKTEVTYSAQFPYGSDGYRTNCNNIPVQSLTVKRSRTGVFIRMECIGWTRMEEAIQMHSRRTVT